MLSFARLFIFLHVILKIVKKLVTKLFTLKYTIVKPMQPLVDKKQLGISSR